MKSAAMAPKAKHTARRAKAKAKTKAPNEAAAVLARVRSQPEPDEDAYWAAVFVFERLPEGMRKDNLRAWCEHLHTEGVSKEKTLVACVANVDSLCETHPTGDPGRRSEAPVQDVGERVPSELLPDGAMIAYFNAHACMEDIAMPTLREQPPQMSADSAMTMLQEFIDSGAHYDETLRAQFPLFRGTAPPGHPYPGAWAEGSPPSSGAAAPAHGSAPFSGRGRRLRDSP